MHEIGETLSAWNSFYVMIGSSSAALTGLMFVVITLVSADDKRTATEEGLTTFSSPTVVHFCCVLFTSAFMSAPFSSLMPIAIFLFLAGTCGSLYIVRVAIRTMKLRTYQPDAEDWAWHVILPFVAYATLLTGAITLHAVASLALYAPAASVTLLVFIGIHNAWDVVTFIALGKGETVAERPAKGSTELPQQPGC